MRKMMALLLALMMVFALCACGGNNNAPTTPTGPTDSNGGNEGKTASVVGKWTAQMDMKAFLELAGQTVTAMPDGILLDIVLEFAEGGDFTMRLKSANFQERYKEYMREMYTAQLLARFEKQNITAEDLERETGMTMEEYVEKEMMGKVNIPEYPEQATTEKYTQDGNKLYIGEQKDDYFTVSVTDSELDFVEASGGDEAPAFFLDLIFQRQK